MTVFRYRAVTTAGEIVEGQREEADQAAVVRWIQGAGNIPIKVEPLGTAGRWLDWLPHVGRRRTVGRNELYGITEALAVLLKAGIPLEQALMIAQNTADSDASAKLLANVLDAVRGGDSFSSALETESGNFSPCLSILSVHPRRQGRSIRDWKGSTSTCNGKRHCVMRLSPPRSIHSYCLEWRLSLSD